MNSIFLNRWQALSIFMFLAPALVAAALPANADEFEPGKLTVNTSELVPQELLTGPHYRVDESTVIEGFMSQFTISSDFGPFTANGNESLHILVGEIAAIAALQDMSKTAAFTEALANSAAKPVKVIANVVEQPVETVKGIPQGIGRLFKRTSRAVSDGAEKLQEVSEGEQDSGGGDDANSPSATTKTVNAGKDFTKNQLGVNSAIRQLSKELNVDPYSTNQVLQKEMSSIAWAMAAGSFATSQIVKMPSVVGDIGQLNNLVWDTDPLDLQLLNEKILGEMGADEALIKAFYDNAFFTITLRTRLVGSLNQLSNAKGRTNLIIDAADAKSPAEARLYSQIAETLVAYEKTRSPISKLYSGIGLPFALAESGTMVLIVPVDYLNWTQNVKDVARRTSNEMDQAASNNGKEAWVHGRISDKAKAGLSAIGWKLYDQGPDRLR
jgi:hypothetical protein